MTKKPRAFDEVAANLEGMRGSFYSCGCCINKYYFLGFGRLSPPAEKALEDSNCRGITGDYGRIGFHFIQLGENNRPDKKPGEKYKGNHFFPENEDLRGFTKLEKAAISSQELGIVKRFEEALKVRIAENQDTPRSDKATE